MYLTDLMIWLVLKFTIHKSKLSENSRLAKPKMLVNTTMRALKLIKIKKT